MSSSPDAKKTKVQFSSDTNLDTSVAGKTHIKNYLIHMFYSPAFAIQNQNVRMSLKKAQKKRIPTACPRVHATQLQ